jgi:hypothetical protein
MRHVVVTVRVCEWQWLRQEVVAATRQATVLAVDLPITHLTHMSFATFLLADTDSYLAFVCTYVEAFHTSVLLLALNIIHLSNLVEL